MESPRHCFAISPVLAYNLASICDSESSGDDMGVPIGMKTDTVAWIFHAAVMGVACVSCNAVVPDALPPRCFVETGHTVRDGFLVRFEAMGGEQSLGYPITEPFEQKGRLVQYFEYGRLEDHPDDSGGPMVKFGMLGEDLGRRRPPVTPDRVPPASDRNSRFYSHIGHVITGDFLTFFDNNGELDVFGFPIAEPVVANGRLVQDFQRARFVWHPNTAAGDRVTLEPLGCESFEVEGLDPALLVPVACPFGAQVISR